MIKPRYSFGGEILILILIAFYDFFEIKTGVERKKFQRRTTPTGSRRNSESLGGAEFFFSKLVRPTVFYLARYEIEKQN